MKFLNPHWKKKRVWVTALVTGVVLLISFIPVWLARQVWVEVSPRRGPITEAVYALGTVKPNNVYQLKLGVTGVIDRLYIEEGQSARANQALVRMDSGVTFRAPFAGTVTGLYFNANEVVPLGANILTLVDTGDSFIRVSLDQESALRVRPGQKAELSFESIRGKKVTGEVTSIYPASGAFQVKIGSDNIPPEVLPEMTADVAIEVARREDALLIPVRASRQGMVWLRRAGKKQKVKAAIGAINGEWAEVLDNSIRPEDLVLVPED